MNINKICLILFIGLLLGCDKKNEAPIRDQVKSIVKDQNTSAVKAEVNELEAKIDSTNSNKIASFDYDLNQPNLSMALSSKLLEISGLSYDPKEDVLLAINDEKGRLYKLNPNDGDIIEDIKFSKKGDYEGIEIIGESIFILESSGQLNLIKNNSDEKAIRIHTVLREANDLEGLGYDKNTNALLLACKGNSNILAKQKLKKTKAVYSLSLVDTTISEEPIFKITDQELEEFVRQEENYKGLSESNKKKHLRRIKSFAPSAIAQHPVLDHFYILSSVGKTLIVIDRASNILSATFLDDWMHRQPEGICFDDDSNMYIANEGKFGVGKIYFYNPL